MLSILAVTAAYGGLPTPEHHGRASTLPASTQLSSKASPYIRRTVISQSVARRTTAPHSSIQTQPGPVLTLVTAALHSLTKAPLTRPTSPCITHISTRRTT